MFGNGAAIGMALTVAARRQIRAVRRLALTACIAAEVGTPTRGPCACGIVTTPLPAITTSLWASALPPVQNN
jgi:hypothetical protein